MKWIVCVFLAAGIFGKLSVFGTDVAKLQPVEVVRVSNCGDTVVIETDTGSSGAGENVASALAALKQTAQGIVFLDTAEYLIVSENMVDRIHELEAYLRPGCSICREKGNTDLKKAASFLMVHDPNVTLKDYQAGIKKIPILKTWEGKMILANG